MGKSELIKKCLNHCPLCKEDITWNISGFRKKDVMRCPACKAEWKFRWIADEVLWMGLKHVGSSDLGKKYDLKIFLIDDKVWRENKYQLSEFWSTYREIKQKDEKRFIELDKEEITNYLVTYMGGDKNLLKTFIILQVGTLRVTKENMTFVGSVGKGLPLYVKALANPLLEIPLRNIDLNNFKLATHFTDDMSSETDSGPFLIIPYMDNKGIIQKPLFRLELALFNDRSKGRLNMFYKKLYLAILKAKKQDT